MAHAAVSHLPASYMPHGDDLFCEPPADAHHHVHSIAPSHAHHVVRDEIHSSEPSGFRIHEDFGHTRHMSAAAHAVGHAGSHTLFGSHHHEGAGPYDAGSHFAGSHTHLDAHHHVAPAAHHHHHVAAHTHVDDHHHHHVAPAHHHHVAPAHHHHHVAPVHHHHVAAPLLYRPERSGLRLPDKKYLAKKARSGAKPRPGTYAGPDEDYYPRIKEQHRSTAMQRLDDSGFHYQRSDLKALALADDLPRCTQPATNIRAYLAGAEGHVCASGVPPHGHGGLLPLRALPPPPEAVPPHAHVVGPHGVACIDPEASRAPFHAHSLRVDVHGHVGPAGPGHHHYAGGAPPIGGHLESVVSGDSGVGPKVGHLRTRDWERVDDEGSVRRQATSSYVSAPSAPPHRQRVSASPPPAEMSDSTRARLEKYHSSA